jgi:hypothetical protein
MLAFLETISKNRHLKESEANENFPLSQGGRARSERGGCKKKKDGLKFYQKILLRISIM